ncbi:hypothetical protein N431DRAFT_435506 [Stipitochalara longipes BDJ]|nr:hypothetical protein N431DRAFT_435506 [Stipitochalara longipes BDJ]
MRPRLLTRAAFTIFTFSSLITPVGAEIGRYHLWTIFKHPSSPNGRPAIYLFPTFDSIKLDPSHKCVPGYCQRTVERRNTVVLLSCFQHKGTRYCSVRAGSKDNWLSRCIGRGLRVFRSSQTVTLPSGRRPVTKPYFPGQRI